MNAPEQLWRPEQVAERFQLSRTRVYELMATGELRSLKIGKSRRVPESAVVEFIERVTTAP